VADRELEVEAARVSGVATVAGVNLFKREDGRWRLVPRSAGGAQQLPLQGWQLPELMQVVAELGNAAPTQLDASTSNDGGGTRVAVPVVTDLC
jgi:hypothetical protein